MIRISSPCIFLLWNRGEPRKLFLMELSLLRQCVADGEPGGVGSSWSVSPEAGTINITINI